MTGNSFVFSSGKTQYSSSFGRVSDLDPPPPPPLFEDSRASMDTHTSGHWWGSGIPEHFVLGPREMIFYFERTVRSKGGQKHLLSCLQMGGFPLSPLDLLFV
jgi:hypothetical protein